MARTLGGKKKKELKTSHEWKGKVGSKHTFPRQRSQQVSGLPLPSTPLPAFAFPLLSVLLRRVLPEDTASAAEGQGENQTPCHHPSNGKIRYWLLSLSSCASTLAATLEQSNPPTSQDKALNEAGLQLPCSASLSKSSWGSGCPGGSPTMLKSWRGCGEEQLPLHKESGQRAALHHTDTRESSPGT